MTNTKLPILLMAILAIPLAGIAHGDNADATTLVKSDGNGFIKEFKVVALEGDPGYSIKVTLDSDKYDVDSNTGLIDPTIYVRITHDIDANPNVDQVISNDSDHIVWDKKADGTDDIGTFTITAATVTLEDTHSIDVKAEATIAVDASGDPEFDETLYPSLSGKVAVTAELNCAFTTTPRITYADMSRDQSDKQTWSPSVNSTINLVPTSSEFTPGDWMNGNDAVVNSQFTTIDGLDAVNGTTTVDNISSPYSFEFETTLDFISNSAYAKSIGKTITQATVVTPDCS